MISDYYTETIILLDKDTSTGGYWSTSTGADYSTATSIPAAVNLLSGDEVAAYDQLGFDAQYNGSGLISSPTMERRDEDWVKDEDDDGMGRYQYSAESLLNYRITTGEYVHIQSMFVNITGTVISGEHAFDGTSPTTSIEIGVK